MQSLLRVRINNQVSTKPFVRLRHSMVQFDRCDAQQQETILAIKIWSQAKDYTGCACDSVLTICII